MQGAGEPVVGKPPTAALPGAAQGISIGPGFSTRRERRTLAWNFFGSFGSGQCGLTENVSLSDAHVSKTTGDGCPFETGATNWTNRRQMNSSEFCFVPVTGPGRAGVTTSTGSAAMTLATMATVMLAINEEAARRQTSRRGFIGIRG